MKRILVIQLRRMGELILTTPALVALRKHYPDAHITLAVDTGSRELLPAFPFIDDSFVFSRKARNHAFWKKLLFASFDICLDYTGSDRSAICSILSKAKRRITFESGSKSQLRPIFYNEFVKSPVREKHTVDHYMALLEALEIPEEGSAAVTLGLPEWAQKKAQQLLEEIKVEGPFAMFHPGTMRPEKYWPPERWAEVIDYCRQEAGLPCVITGSMEAYEREHIAAIREKTEVHDLSGRTDLLTLAALAGRASLLLSVDSMVMHMGAASRTPQVALFGKTNAFHWRPRHPKAVSIQAGQPGTNPGFSSPFRSEPMSEISTQAVISAIRSLLNADSR